jgi:HD-like signal output (HDOD) protein
VDTPISALPNPAVHEHTQRHERLLEIIHDGLLPFPPTVLELTSVLSGPSPDIKKAAKLIRTDAALSAQLLRMCSSPVKSPR